LAELLTTCEFDINSTKFLVTMDKAHINENLENGEMVSENTATSPEQSTAEQSTQENKPVEESDKLKEELAGAKDKYLRLYSEFENFRRRTAKEKLEMIQSANEQLIKSLLPIADDFERAEKSMKEKNDQDAEGFILIQNKFKKVLELYSLKVMDVQKGSDFNADLHEAITQIPAPEPSLKGKVVEVVEKGYLLSDKVIRFAKVVVGS
jgi:molecular chaperone GrpE